MSEIVEILFKGEVRELFANPGPVILRPGDYVVVQADKGEDMGRVIGKGEWVSKKAQKPPVRQVVRKANKADLERRDGNAAKEADASKVCRERIEERELKMKLVDVECRFDGNRITFYFTAEKRVDFRELVKDLASIYRTRIELRQIGVRDEAKRVGGFGSCGRKFCCTTFLREFEPVTLKMAKDQHLSLSPAKISGACGRLMCCLMYEVADYRKALQSYPRVGSKVMIGDREVKVNRVDVFREGVFVDDPEGGEEFVPAGKLRGRFARGDENGEAEEIEAVDDAAEEEAVYDQGDTPEAVATPGQSIARGEAERKGAEKRGGDDRPSSRRNHGRQGRDRGQGRQGHPQDGGARSQRPGGDGERSGRGNESS